MPDLVKGIHRFRGEDFRQSHPLFAPGRDRARTGALIITCSDMELEVRKLIPSDPGVPYLQRNFGNLVEPHDPASGGPSPVEQALDLYPIGDIVVCGHARCDVMRLILSKSLGELIAEGGWLRHAAGTLAILERYYPGMAGGALEEVAAAENVLVQLENLRATPEVARRLDLGTLRLHGWLYSGGEILAYEPRVGRYAPLAQ